MKCGTKAGKQAGRHNNVERTTYDDDVDGDDGDD